MQCCPPHASFLPRAVLLLWIALHAALSATPVTYIDPLPYKVEGRMPDVVQDLSPSRVHVQGWLGARIEANATNRLLTVDLAPLLAGFRQKPGTHPWIGEHIGKWMHAATLAWAYTGDTRLRSKLDQAAEDLMSAQEPDGYLGTYLPSKRFGLFPEADWDVWSHKYNLIGLLTYYQFTGNAKALQASAKIGDLLLRTFGPGKKSILSAGTHVGMASTSILEPMVLLYRYTNDERYLEFCRYIVESWDEPTGPKILHTLLAEHQVNKTANGKAYEMLSNLVGLCELARVTGNREFLQAVENAWQDIVSKRLYISGSASQGEHFHQDSYLPNKTSAHVAETCVTTTWIQLNLQLLRLTGEARFANQLETSFYNHLTAAQHPAGGDWCYFTSLDGRKPYQAGINCCHSSGPRAMALAPSQAYLCAAGDEPGININTFEPSSADLVISNVPVHLSQFSRFPFRGQSTVDLTLAKPAIFTVSIRLPPWSDKLQISVNGKEVLFPVRKGWAVIPARSWMSGDRIALTFPLKPVLQPGDHGNSGLAAAKWGPFVMAYDSAANPGLPAAPLVGLANDRLRGPSARRLLISANIRSPRLKTSARATLIPFADAGATGSSYKVWLPVSTTGLPQTSSVLATGEESRSGEGNVEGSIVDGDPDTFVVTFDNRPQQTAWFAVHLDQPIEISRVVFVPGKLFHDGGWFDTSKQKPLIQIQRDSQGTWETVAELTGYPATTTTDPRDLKTLIHLPITQDLGKRVRAISVRIIGKPASGDNPKQAFASCAELQAYAD